MRRLSRIVQKSRAAVQSVRAIQVYPLGQHQDDRADDQHRHENQSDWRASQPYGKVMTMKHYILATLLALPLPAVASDEAAILTTIQGIATAADAQDWSRLDMKFGDYVILNQLSLETDQGARVQDRTVIGIWAELLPRFDNTHHEISQIEVLGVSSVVARATARYHATYDLHGQTWEQTGRLDYVLKNTDAGWRVVALNTTPEWENRRLSDLFLQDEGTPAGNS